LAWTRIFKDTIEEEEGRGYNTGGRGNDEKMGRKKGR